MPPPAMQYPAVRHDRTGEPFSVRPGEFADRPALLAFYVGFEPKRAAQGLPPAGADRVARWLDSVLPNGIHLVAFRDQRLIAHAFVLPTDRPGTGEYAVFLNAPERGRGVGTELNRLAITAAIDAGYQRLWLSAEPHNRAAIRSYEKVGFRYVPESIYSTELEMELPLQGEAAPPAAHSLREPKLPSVSPERPRDT